MVCMIVEPRHEMSNNVVCATSNGSDQPGHTCSLIRAFASRLNSLRLTLPTEHHLEFLSLKGCCKGLSESTLVKMPHCWKSHVTALLVWLLTLWVPMELLIKFDTVKSRWSIVYIEGSPLIISKIIIFLFLCS